MRSAGELERELHEALKNLNVVATVTIDEPCRYRVTVWYLSTNYLSSYLIEETELSDLRFPWCIMIRKYIQEAWAEFLNRKDELI